MATLVPCPGCARHVRAGESTCPFCDSAIGVTPERVLAPAPSDRLLARAAITFAAAAATSLTACGKEPTDKPPPAPTNTATENLPAPAYGPPPTPPEPPTPAPTTTTTATTSAPTPSASTSAKPIPTSKTGPTAVPAYGVPPIDRNPTPTPKK